MKPFDLNKAMEGEPVVTRDGREVLDIHYFKDADNDGQCIVYHAKDSPLRATYIAGNCFKNGDHSVCDLFMAPKTEKLTIYVSKHKNANGLYQTTYAIPDGTSVHIDDFYHSGMRKVEVEIEVDE